jgi:phytoene dehydrogenase-like protein
MADASRAYDAIVIGAGHNGLVTAGYLARAGLRPLVLERRERPGGAADTAELLPGVRVPTVAHTVGRFRPSVIRDLRLSEHGLALIHSDIRATALQPDGPALDLWADPARTAEGLRARSKPDGDAFPAFDRKVRSLASFVAYVQAATPPDLRSPSLADALTGLRLGRAVRSLGGRANTREALRVLPMAVADLVGEAFEDDALRGAVACRGVQFTAMGPWSAGTAAVLLSDSAGNGGGAGGQCVFARGGPGTLAGALLASARSFGAEIRCGSEVMRIAERDGMVAGVLLASGEELSARVVVSNADPKRTLLGLLDPVVLGPTLAWRAENVRTPGSVSKVNLALRGIPRTAGDDGHDAERLRGRILVAPGIDYLERAFDASKYGRMSERPYLEATIPTLSDPGLAPEGTHVMSVIAQWTPYELRDGHWDARRDELGDLVLDTLEAVLPGISDLVTARQVLTPLDLERDYAMSGGNPFHAEPGLDQFFAWRPLLGHARYRMPVRGLYLCGSGAHPGGGVTGGPGANAAREILADLKRRAR